jgi:hypothetical protein
VYLQQDPAMASMMTAFNDPTKRVAMEEKLKALQSDAQLAPIMKEIEETGPAALMKCVPFLSLCDNTLGGTSCGSLGQCKSMCTHEHVLRSFFVMGSPGCLFTCVLHALGACKFAPTSHYRWVPEAPTKKSITAEQGACRGL